MDTDLNETVVEVEADERGGHPAFSRDRRPDGSSDSTERVRAGLVVEGGGELRMAR